MCTSLRVIQAAWGEIPEKQKECMDSVKKIYPQVEVFRFPKSEYSLFESSKWRWEMMLKYDDVLYLDWDIELKKAIELSDTNISAIYFKGYPDNCLIHSPSKVKFQNLENERIKRGIEFSTLGWFRKVMRDKNIIEIKCGSGTGISHYRLSGLNKLKQQHKKLKEKDNGNSTKIS